MCISSGSTSPVPTPKGCAIRTSHEACHTTTRPAELLCAVTSASCTTAAAVPNSTKRLLDIHHVDITTRARKAIHRQAPPASDVDMRPHTLADIAGHIMDSRNPTTTKTANTPALEPNMPNTRAYIAVTVHSPNGLSLWPHCVPSPSIATAMCKLKYVG